MLVLIRVNAHVGLEVFWCLEHSITDSTGNTGRVTTDADVKFEVSFTFETARTFVADVRSDLLVSVHMLFQHVAVGKLRPTELTVMILCPCVYTLMPGEPHLGRVSLSACPTDKHDSIMCRPLVSSEPILIIERSITLVTLQELVAVFQVVTIQVEFPHKCQVTHRTVECPRRLFLISSSISHS